MADLVYLDEIIDDFERNPEDAEAAKRYMAWSNAFKSQTGNTIESYAEGASAAIPKREWDDFADQEFEDIFLGDVNDTVRTYIDWERWRDDLKHDYIEIVVDGVIYYLRRY